MNAPSFSAIRRQSLRNRGKIAERPDGEPLALLDEFMVFLETAHRQGRALAGGRRKKSA